MIDVASYQPRDLTALIAEYQPQHVVVRLYHVLEAPPQEHSTAQIESARANGCSVGAYMWLYHGNDPGAQVRSALRLADRAQLSVPVLWLDIEEYPPNGSLPTTDEITDAVEECLAHGVRPGIYTGRPYWLRLGDPQVFNDLPLWHAAYDGNPTLDVGPLYGGWERCMGHQYRGRPLDLDVFDPSVC